MSKIHFLLAAFLVIVGPSYAAGQAVSALNGMAAIEAGSVSLAGRSSAAGALHGTITTPIGESFGFQADGLAATAYSSFLGGGGAHFFWRDPQIGLVGPTAAMIGGRGTRIGWYGGEGELYAGVVTLAALAGYQDTVTSSNKGVSGGFYQGRLTLYPIPDLALTLRGGQMAGAALGAAQIAYQPTFERMHNMAFFVSGAVGDSSFYKVTTGVQFYFGTDKTLIRRHREDDPLPTGESFAASGWNGLAAELGSAGSSY